VRQGRIEEAEQLLAGLEGHRAAAEAMATLHLARGKAALAAAVIERRLDGTSDDLTTAPLLRLLADAKLAAGDLDAARGAALRLADLAERSGRPPLQAAALLTTARVDAAAGGPAPAAALDRACALFETLGMPFEAASARLDAARAMATSDPALAAEDARRAQAAFERLGARPHADLAAAALREMGAGSRPGPRAAGDLTRREREVLDLVSHGLSNTDIGARLFISAKTVEHHVGRILSKLGLRSRSEATAWSLRQPSPKSGPK
jgi:ATP/maltotriose-dependent transcriptional regulator MalT